MSLIVKHFFMLFLALSVVSFSATVFTSCSTSTSTDSIIDDGEDNDGNDDNGNSDNLGSWAPLGEGVDDLVWDLAIDGDGNLYVGGKFLLAGGRTVNHIARWDGSNWSALGVGLNSDVYSVAYSNSGFLYAITNDVFSDDGVSEWDGTNWKTIATISGQGNKLAVSDAGNLYLGLGNNSRFDTPGITTPVSVWDGTQWTSVGDDLSGSVNAIVVDGEKFYVAGRFRTDGRTSGPRNHLVVQWNGAEWESLGEGMNDVISALALDADGNLYAGGRFTTAGNVIASGIAKWNGAAWEAVGDGITSSSFTLIPVMTIVIGPDGTLYIGGSFEEVGGVPANSIAQWDGNVWSALGDGESGAGVGSGGVDAMIVGPAGELYVGGTFRRVNGRQGVEASNIAVWYPPEN